MRRICSILVAVLYPACPCPSKLPALSSAGTVGVKCPSCNVPGRDFSLALLLQDWSIFIAFLLIIIPEGQLFQLIVNSGS